VTDGDVPLELLQAFIVENLGDQSHSFVLVGPLAVGRHDASTLLTTVLERVQPEKRTFGRVAVIVDTEQAAFFV
jgi:hypothetical protein